MHVWCSTAQTLRNFFKEFLGGVGGMYNTFSRPVPSQQQSVGQPKIQNDKCIDRFVTRQHLIEKRFSLLSCLDSPGSPQPSGTVDMQNMHLNAVHITCGRKPVKKKAICWRGGEDSSQNCWCTVVGCYSFRCIRLTQKIRLIRRFVCARQYLDWFRLV